MATKRFFLVATFFTLIRLSLALSIKTRNLWHSTSTRSPTSLNCVGKILQPLPKSDDENYRADGGKHSDTNFNWRTPETNIISVNREKFTVRPELITFDAYNTLIEPSQSIGRWYREALHSACDTSVRLPRPILFTNAFNKVYAEM